MLREARASIVLVCAWLLVAPAGSGAHTPADAPPAAAADVAHVAPVEQRRVRSARPTRGRRRLALGPALVVVFDAQRVHDARSATLSLRVRGRRRVPLRAYSVRGRSVRRARVLHGPVRGRYVGRTHVAFDVGASLRGRTRTRFLIVAADRRSWRVAGRPVLVTELEPPPAVAAPMPQPTPTPEPTPMPTPEPTPTATPERDPEPALVVAAGDISCSPDHAKYEDGAGSGFYCRQMATSDAMLAQDPDAVLPLGDNQYEDGTLAEFETAYAPSWGRALHVSHPVAGNHEYQTPGATGYFDYFNGVGVFDGRAGPRDRGYYSFDVGTWHVVALNSNCGYVPCAAGSEQEKWLRADLAMNESTCTLAYFHTPRWTSGNVGNYRAVTPLWQALYDHGADLILNGHAHVYERFAPQDPAGAADAAHGIRQLINGAGGEHLQGLGTLQPNSEVLDNTTLGILRLRLGAGSYSWDFLPVVGTFSDQGSDVCHGPPGP